MAIWARLSIWNTPTVSARQIMANVAGSSAGRVAMEWVMAAMLRDEAKTAIQVGERAQAQQVHLEQPQRLDVRFVPLDDGPTRHRRVLDGHQVDHRLVPQQEPAGVDREVARELAELRGQLAEVPMCGSLGVQSRLGEDGGRDLAGAGQELGQPGEPRFPAGRAPCPRRAPPSGRGSG